MSTRSTRPRVVAVVDTDSYLKWGVNLLDQMPDTFEKTILLADGPAAASSRQIRVALKGTRFERAAIIAQPVRSCIELLRSAMPDVLFLSARGTMIDVILSNLDLSDPARPVIVTGLPGISIPATERALQYRSAADLFVLHSKREIGEFSALARALDIQMQFGLASLPFMGKTGDRGVEDKTDIVFAAQANVPKSVDDRDRMVSILIETAEQNPGLRVILKTRARNDENQTHKEHHGLDGMLFQRRQTGVRVPENLVVEDGPLIDYLSNAVGMVSVSSTALIEGIAQGVPVVALTDFGVSDRLINTVFVGSGVMGNSIALYQCEFRFPNLEWQDQNYFHQASLNDWQVRLLDLIETRRQAGLPPANRLLDHMPDLRAQAQKIELRTARDDAPPEQEKEEPEPENAANKPDSNRRLALRVRNIARSTRHKQSG